jgi:DNA-binding transcriptional ArsR family regulator
MGAPVRVLADPTRYRIVRLLAQRNDANFAELNSP